VHQCSGGQYQYSTCHPWQAVKGLDALRDNVLMGREHVIGEGFPVRQRQQFVALAVGLEEVKLLFDRQCLVRAAGDDQRKSIEPFGGIDNGQGPAAAPEFAPVSVVAGPGWRFGDQNLPVGTVLLRSWDRATFEGKALF